jgi:hypothetical protein
VLISVISGNKNSPGGFNSPVLYKEGGGYLFRSCLSYLFFIYLAKAAYLNLHCHAFKGVVMQRKYNWL